MYTLPTFIGSVADGKSAFSSSSSTEAVKVIDDNTDAEVGSGTCLVTNTESRPWYVLDKMFSRTLQYP